MINLLPRLSAFALAFLALTGFFSLANPWHGAAQEASVELTVNSTNVEQGDVLRLTISFVNCKIKEIDPPQIPGLEWRMGPSTSNSTQWINGVTTSEQRYTYGYVVTGSNEIQIPKLKWNTNEGVLLSNPIRLLVSSTDQPKAQGPQPTRTPRAVQRDLVTAIEPNKRTVYLGEPLILTYRIYNRYNNLDVRSFDVPELEGFWKETVPAEEARWEPQLINGKRYNVATVRQIVAFPQQTGKVILKDFTLDGYLRINFFEGREIQATSDPVEIEVLPLPESAPERSLGTFSKLTVEQSLSEDSLSTNEAVTLEVSYRGFGNLKFIQKPDVAWPSEFEVFDPEIDDRIAITAQGETGSRTFKYVAIPRAPGNYTFPELEAVWFDPLTGQHVTSTAPGLTLNVKKGAEPLGTSSGMNFTHQQEVQVLNQDVRHIMNECGRFLPRTRPAWTTWAFGMGMGIGPLVFGFLWLARRRQRMEELDVRGAKSRKAWKALLRSLNNPSQVSIEEIGEAMEQYLMAKLGVDRSQLSRKTVHDLVSDKDANLAKQWDAMWADCEFQRYGGAQGNQPAIATKLLKLAEATENIWT